VFDDQHNLWTNVFASVYLYSSQGAKMIGLRHWGCNTSNEDKKSLEVEDSRTKEDQRIDEEIHEVGSQPAFWWRTGQWTTHVWFVPDCPVGHPNSLRREAQKRAFSGYSTGQSGSGRIQRSTAVDLNDRLAWQGIEQWTVLVWCVRRQEAVASFPTTRIVGRL
jgi:hypothetical protein